MKRMFIIFLLCGIFFLLTGSAHAGNQRLLIENGSERVSTYVTMRDRAASTLDTGVTITNIDLYYTEEGAAETTWDTSVTALDSAVVAWEATVNTNKTCFHVGHGVYRVDWPDAAFDGGVGKQVRLVVIDGDAGAFTEIIDVILSPPSNITQVDGTDAKIYFERTSLAGMVSSSSTTTVPVNGYIDGVSTGLVSNHTTGRTYINGGHMARIRKTGLIDTIEFEISTLTNLLDETLQFVVYRWDSGNSGWDSIVVSDKIPNASLAAPAWNSLGSADLGTTFTSTVVNRGDVLGVYAKGDGVDWQGALFGTGSTGDVDNWQVQYDTSDETATQDWQPGTTSESEWNFNLYAKMLPPKVIGVGDSLMLGATSGGDNARGFLGEVSADNTWTSVNLTDNIIHSLSGYNEELFGGMNHGIGSTDTDDWASTGNDYITTHCINFAPKYAIIELGINDVSGAVAWSTARANYINIFQNLLANQITPIMIKILQWPNGTGQQQADIIEYNENLTTLCSQFGIKLIDGYNIVADASDSTNRNATLFGTNASVHPTSDAYKALASAILLAMANTGDNVASGVVEKALSDINLDHLMKTAVDTNYQTTVHADSVIGYMTASSATSSYDRTTDSLEKLADQIIAGGSIVYAPTTGTITTGNQDAGTYVSTATDDATDWTIGDEDGTNTIDVIATTSMGANRIATGVTINGQFDENGSGTPVVEIYARDYTTAGNDDWDKLSAGTADTEMRNRVSDKTYIFSLAAHHTCAAANGGDAVGDVQVKFVSERGTTADDDILYLDYIGITATSSGAVSPAIYADAVWAKPLIDIRPNTKHNLVAGHVIKSLVDLGTEIAVSGEDSNKSFTLSDGIATNDAYNGAWIWVRDESATNREIERRRIVDWTSGLVVTVDRDFSFLPTDGDHIHIGGYGDVNATHVGGTAQTANDMSGDIDDILDDTSAYDSNAERAAAIWDEPVAGNVSANTFGGALDAVGTDINNRTYNSNLDAMLNVTDAVSTTLITRIDNTVDHAMQTIGLDELLTGAIDGEDLSDVLNNDSVIGHILSVSDLSNYDRSVHSIEAMNDKIDTMDGLIDAIKAYWDSLTITGGFLEVDLKNLDGTTVKSTSGNIHALPGNI